MKIDISFHLFHLKDTIGDEEYEYKSKGGRILVLMLLLGFLARAWGYINLSTFVIIAAAFLGCVLWDLLTVGIYLINIKKKITNYLNDNEKEEE
ncbi:MAG: hypothetical protein UIM53_02835 [Acutalibacteraceae bacterium]|nr:hypothetical protein [Acutalibacteraceae bacterium]